MRPQQQDVRTFDPPAAEWRHVAWDGGRFDTAHRPYTESVTGRIRVRHPLVLATLRGGARHVEIRTACGHRHRGAERAGAVSFVPAGCEREIRLERVRTEWASLSLPPVLLENADSGARLRPFSNVQDEFAIALLREMARLRARDGGLDVAYCETMSHALACHVLRRYGGRAPESSSRVALPAWRLRRIDDHLHAHLGEPVRIAELAALTGLSEGHFHRAFRAATGVTPLRYLNEMRVRRAAELLVAPERPAVAEVALRVGFVSPSHFTRVFRDIVGINPARFRDR